MHLLPPFRAEHIGSLKRPAILLQKRKELDEGKITAEELLPVENQAIDNIVKMQREVGIKSFTDGEFRRHMFYDGVFDNLEGMEYLPDVPLELFMSYVPDTMAFKHHSFKKAASYICVGKLKRTKPFYKAQYEYLKSITSPEEHKNIKITVCAPEWFHLRHGPYAYKKEAYTNDEDYFADIAQAYREEIRELYALGCRNIQFDDPLLAYFCAESMITGMTEQGVDHERLLNLYIKTYNDCLKDKPEDFTVGLHLCRGNFRDGLHFSEGGYDRIAVKLFNEINVDTYYLEYDTERAGTFEPLKFLPKDKSVVLGLITSKFPKLEDVEELKKRIYAAADTIANGQEPRSKEEALNQICISPQCGFASHADGNPVTEEDVVKKLSLVVKTAREIWPDA
ncbi:UROD/MetE-like protein [Dentipellis sp. KUC8613]|nr:UROD/MetE-like protein [Dentipellis sp. KUC8613]